MLKQLPARYIVHIDMDAFFAAVEQRDNPLYRGKPVIVGADPKMGKGRGVVATCSYEARRFGIHSAMPISTAYRKCPHAVFVRPDMEKYSRVSKQINTIFYDFSPFVEQVSIDEAFLDITTTYHLFGTPRATCLSITSRIFRETQLTASAGLAPTKMAAKIASDLKKPNGFVEVSQDNLVSFLWPLTIEKIWGLGKKGSRIAHMNGIYTIGDLAHKDRAFLMRLYGKSGAVFWQSAQGIDPRMVETDREAVSISNEITFDKDTSDREYILSAIASLSDKVVHRLRAESRLCRTITVKIRTHGFKTYTRSHTLREATHFADIISSTAKQLFASCTGNKNLIRLIGVKISNLQDCSGGNDLFPPAENDKKEKVHRIVETIRERFGNDAIRRADSIQTDTRHR